MRDGARRARLTPRARARRGQAPAGRACEGACQTEPHPPPPRAPAPVHQWSVWALRRRALDAANLRGRATRSAQTAATAGRCAAQTQARLSGPGQVAAGAAGGGGGAGAGRAAPALQCQLKACHRGEWGLPCARPGLQCWAQSLWQACTAGPAQPNACEELQLLAAHRQRGIARACQLLTLPALACHMREASQCYRRVTG
jgi:hypothetical protein